MIVCDRCGKGDSIIVARFALEFINTNLQIGEINKTCRYAFDLCPTCRLEVTNKIVEEATKCSSSHMRS